MILTSTSERVPMTPSWLCDGENKDKPKPGAPVFFVRTGSVIERGQMEAELTADHRAGPINPYELIAAIRGGIETLLAADPNLDEALALIDAEAQGEADSLSEQDKQALVGIRAVLAEHWQPYRALMAQSERRRLLAPTVALRRFCTGIEAAGVKFAVGPDGLVAESTLASIDPFVLTHIGGRAFNLQFAGANAAGFLPQPSPSGDSQPRSPADDTSTAGGPSKSVSSSTVAQRPKRRRGKKIPE